MVKSAVGIAAVLLWSMTCALAQGPAPAPQDQTAVTPKLNLTLEQHHVIKEVVKDMKVAPATTWVGSVGDVVPADTASQPMPGEIASKVPQIKSHRLIVTAQRILIVDPKDGKIADVIELN